MTNSYQGATQNYCGVDITDIDTIECCNCGRINDGDETECTECYKPLSTWSIPKIKPKYGGKSNEKIR